MKVMKFHLQIPECLLENLLEMVWFIGNQLESIPELEPDSIKKELEKEDIVVEVKEEVPENQECHQVFCDG